MATRRSVLRGLLITTGASLLPPALRAHQVTEAPWRLLPGITEGADLGLGWHAGGLGPPRKGAAFLVLRHSDGREAHVHVCRNGGKPKGVASTAELDFVLMNGGGGHAATEEHLAQALLTLAARVTQAGP